MRHPVLLRIRTSIQIILSYFLIEQMIHPPLLNYFAQRPIELATDSDEHVNRD